MERISKLEKRVLKLLRYQKYTIDELAEITDQEIKVIKATLKTLRNSGTALKRESDIYYIEHPVDGNTFVFSKANPKRKEVQFVSTSDWHIGNIHHNSGALEHCIGEVKRSIIEPLRVLHSGDIHDGHEVYRGQLNELVAWSIDEQTEMSAQTLNKLQIFMYGIGGNHDFSYTRTTGARPSKILSMKTDRYVDLGDIKADFILEGVIIRLLHGAGGNAYAQSYPAQRYMRNLAEGAMSEIPDVLLIGHYHTNPCFNIYDTVVIHPGNFHNPNDFTIRRGLRGPQGLYVVRLLIERGQILSYETKFIKG